MEVTVVGCAQSKENCSTAGGKAARVEGIGTYDTGVIEYSYR